MIPYFAVRLRLFYLIFAIFIACPSPSFAGDDGSHSVLEISWLNFPATAAAAAHAIASQLLPAFEPFQGTIPVTEGTVYFSQQGTPRQSAAILYNKCTPASRAPSGKLLCRYKLPVGEKAEISVKIDGPAVHRLSTKQRDVLVDQTTGNCVAPGCRITLPELAEAAVLQLIIKPKAGAE